MPFPLPEDFKPGTPLCDLITTEIMKTVTGILNHLTVEVRDGVDYPYIEKTARPGEQQPWVIVLPAQSATGPELADNIPLSDDDPGNGGTAETASRSDHSHALNVLDSLAPLPDNFGGDSRVGELPSYARTDHAHAVNTPYNEDEFEPRQDGIDNDGNFFTGEDIGRGSSGTSKIYADALHSHKLNSLRDDNVSPAGTIPLPVGSHILGDLVEGSEQVCWACRLGSQNSYAAWDHVHPDRLPVVYGTSEYSFKSSGYVYDNPLTAYLYTKDETSFYMRNHVRLDIPIVTRVSMQFLPDSGDTKTYLLVFTRLLSFDYSGRLTGISGETSKGIYS